jgi:hypothetical protein
MFEGQGMVLKRGVEIGLGEMAGVTGFGEERQIGELQSADEPGVALSGRPVLLLPPMAVDCQSRKQGEVEQNESQEEIGASQENVQG